MFPRAAGAGGSGGRGGGGRRLGPTAGLLVAEPPLQPGEGEGVQPQRGPAATLLCRVHALPHLPAGKRVIGTERIRGLCLCLALMWQ